MTKSMNQTYLKIELDKFPFCFSFVRFASAQKEVNYKEVDFGNNFQLTGVEY